MDVVETSRTIVRFACIPAVFFCCLAGPTNAESAKPRGPVFAAELTQVDLGTILTLESLRHTFAFRNEGTEDLEVRIEKTSCSCASEFVSESLIAPGESGAIEVRYVGRTDDPRIGHKNLMVYVKTNDPQTPEVVFTVRAYLGNRVTVEPTAIDFGDVEHQAEVSRYVDVASTFDLSSNLDVQVSHPDLSVQADPVHEPAGAYRFRVTLRPIANMVSYREVVSFRNSEIDQTLIEVPVRASIRYPFESDPPILIFGEVRPNESSEKAIVLVPRAADTISQMAVHSTHPAFAAKARRIPATKNWEIVVSLDTDWKNWQAGVVSANVIAEGTDGKLLAVVPIRAVLQGS